jgi:hypothetical protein
VTGTDGGDRVPDTDTAAFLDRLEALHAQATPGPWENPYPFTKLIDAPGSTDNMAIVQCDNAADAAAIVAEHNAVPRLVAAVRAAYALAEEFAVLGRKLHSVVAADAFADAAQQLRAALNEALEAGR